MTDGDVEKFLSERLAAKFDDAFDEAILGTSCTVAVEPPPLALEVIQRAVKRLDLIGAEFDLNHRDPIVKIEVGSGRWPEWNRLTSQIKRGQTPPEGAIFAGHMVWGLPICDAPDDDPDALRMVHRSGKHTHIVTGPQSSATHR